MPVHRLTPKRPTAILINPWIHDFAAYDLWAKPLGILYLAGYLKAWGFHVRLLDCLHAHRPGLEDPPRAAYGTGKYLREAIDPPAPLRTVRRPYHRYGIPPSVFQEELGRMERPDVILVTSHMTYWYPGIRETVKFAKETHPGVPVVLGGIYARLCPEHAARNTGADRVVRDGDFSGLPSVLAGLGINAGDPPRTDTPILPAYELFGQVDSVCILTSVGCPFRCRYCASPFLNPRMERRSPRQVVKEIRHWHDLFSVRDFAFYDDALLVGHEAHLVPILEGVLEAGLKLRFHTPNALHVREITPQVARHLFQAGFRSLRLGLETADPVLHRQMGGKVKPGDFHRAMDALEAAGFERAQVGAYLLTGLPGQPVSSVHQTLDVVEETGAAPYLAEYSPIPRTGLWQQALRHSRFDLAREPLFHNNTLLPCWPETDIRGFSELKQRVREIRGKIHGRRRVHALEWGLPGRPPS